MAGIKVISFVNMKGGVGKTTLTANIGWGLTNFHSKKVLLIDIDMQANLSQYFMKPQQYLVWITQKNEFKDKLTTMDIYRKKAVSQPSVVKKGGKKINRPDLSLDNLTLRIHEKDGAYLDLIPSTLELVDLDSTSAENRLKRFIEKIKDKYDYIFIDCPPTMYFFTKSALIASDSYLIPIKPDHLSSFGLFILEKAIEQVRYDYDIKLTQIGIVFTLVRGLVTNLMKTTMSNIRKLKDKYVFNNTITDLTSVGEASKENKTVFQFPSASQSADQFKKLSEEFLKRIEEVNKDE